MSTDLFDRYAALDPAAGAVPDWQSAEARVPLAVIDERTFEMQTDQHAQRALEPQRKRGGVWAAAAAFAAVIVVGVIAVAASSGDETSTEPTQLVTSSTVAASTTTIPPSTSAAAPVFTTEDALAVKDAYFAAYEVGDIDAMLSLFSPELNLSMPSGSTSLEEWEKLYTWKSAEGTVLMPALCQATTGDAGVSIVCNYAHHQYPAVLVGAPATPHTLNMTVNADGKVSLLRDRFGSPSWLTDAPFAVWMGKVHPEDTAVAACCSWASVEEARTNGRARAEYAEEWAAYIEATGCAWDDQVCVLDSN